MILQPLTKGSTTQTPSTPSGRVLPPLTSIKTPTKTVSKPVQKTITQPKKIEQTPKSIFDNLQKAVSDAISRGTNARVKLSNKELSKKEGLGAPIGRFLQKTPNVDAGTKFQKTFKATDTETQVVNFISNFPSTIAQSYGKTLERLATDRGRKEIKQGVIDLPKTISEIKKHIDNKDWSKAMEVALSNPALTVALDVSDFIPIGAIFGKGIKEGSKVLLKNLVKEGISESEEKIVKEIVEQGTEKIIKQTPNEIKPFEKLVEKPKEPKLIEAPKTKQLEAPKEKYVQGEGFEMTDKANIRKVQVMKSINEYKTALEKYNKNPNPSNLKIVQETRKTMVEFKSQGLIENIKKVEIVKPKTQTISPIIKSEEKTVIKPTEVSVPREQLPVSSPQGKEKVSRLEARITASLKDIPEETKQALGETKIKGMTNPDQIKKASEYVVNNTEEAMAVVRGEKLAPKGLLDNAVFVALHNLAKDDSGLARKIASLKSSRFGQEIEILKEIDKDSPVKLMSDVVKIREEAFKKRYGGKNVQEVSDKIVKDIKKKVKVPDKYDWNNFIKGLEC